MSILYRVASKSLTPLSRSTQNRVYRDFIRSLPCSVSGRTWGIEAAHTGSRGLGQKASDLDCIPLNRIYHQPGYPLSYHTLGRVRFEKQHSIDIRKLIAGLQKKAVEQGIDLSGSDTPRKRPGRAGGFRRRGVA
jgi:hypothetical protein